MITVRVDGVLLGTQREMLLELPDVRLVERLLDAGEGACQETDVLVLSGSERIPSALGHRFPELKLLVLSLFRGRECLPDLPAGAELVVLPQSREPLLGDWVWSHLLGMRWHVGHRVPGSLMPRENLHMAGPLVLSGGSELVNHVAHRALAWGLAVWSPQDGGGCLASGVEQVSWREALKGGGTFCLLDERPAPHRDLG